MTILGLAEKFEIMNLPDPARPSLTRLQHFLTVYFLEIMKDKDMKFCHHLHLSLQFKLSKFRIDIFGSSETIRFSAT